MFDSLFGGITSEPTMLEIILEIIKGLSMNFLITFLAAIIPLGVGIPLSLLAKNQGVSKVFAWVKIPFEIVCVPLLVMVFYYSTGFVFNSEISSALCVIFALAFSYMMYIPSRYNQNESFLKNTLLNSLGLISALFKWSFVAGILLATRDALRVTTMLVGRTFESWPYIVLFFIVTAVLVTIEVPKAAIKHFMK